MSDFMLSVECLFSNTWMLLTSIDFPGTEMSIAQILVGAFMVGFSLRILAHALGLGLVVTDIRKAPAASNTSLITTKGGNKK